MKFLFMQINKEKLDVQCLLKVLTSSEETQNTQYEFIYFIPFLLNFANFERLVFYECNEKDFYDLVSILIKILNGNKKKISKASGFILGTIFNSVLKINNQEIKTRVKRLLNPASLETITETNEPRDFNHLDTKKSFLKASFDILNSSTDKSEIKTILSMFVLLDQELPWCNWKNVFVKLEDCHFKTLLTISSKIKSTKTSSPSLIEYYVVNICKIIDQNRITNNHYSSNDSDFFKLFVVSNIGISKVLELFLEENQIIISQSTMENIIVDSVYWIFQSDYYITVFLIN